MALATSVHPNMLIPCEIGAVPCLCNINRETVVTQNLDRLDALERLLKRRIRSASTLYR